MSTLYVSVNAKGVEKPDIDYSSKQEMASYLMKKVTEQKDSMSEDEKAKMSERIDKKLKSGKKLSTEEEKYLQQTNPWMYQQYLRIRATADAMKEQMKHAKSKEEVNNIISTSMNLVSDKDPCKELVIAALDETAKEFKSSMSYQKLPNKDSEVDGKHNGISQYKGERDLEEDEDDDFDPMSWSPLQEALDVMPQFSVSA